MSDSIFIQILLFPIAMLYKIVLLIRHQLFDWKIIRSKKFDIPIICVGNLSMGGTGKTPHVEYLIRLLSGKYRIGVLSRGYKRKTEGFVLAQKGVTANDIGDEPMQFFKKYDVMVAVDANRCEGVKKMLNQENAPEVIILDDAFQHRKIEAGLNILLTDYHKLYSDDYLFPVGKLRDVVSAAKRAQLIVITKSPKIFSPFFVEEVKKKLKIKSYQQLFFSYLNYQAMVPVTKAAMALKDKSIRVIILFCAIANPLPLKEYLSSICMDLIVFEYDDHHRFKKEEIESIRRKYDDTLGKKVIITTEKDLMRLVDTPEFEILKDTLLFYTPVEACFHNKDLITFDNQILKYVKENTKKC
ncbi:MAG: tetraacyldisaccharide 4'-kinase [Lentimicrobiaceae bacterium]|nr:tetraacyldisaccharide 4'-kinase [Lentimicrobiaceae bacterium]